MAQVAPGRRALAVPWRGWVSPRIGSPARNLLAWHWAPSPGQCCWRPATF